MVGDLDKKLTDVVGRIEYFIAIRGGPARDEQGNYIGTSWPMMLEAATEIKKLRARLRAKEVMRKRCQR